MELVPEDGDLEIIYEDDLMLAISKPAGKLSHPNPGQSKGSILNVIHARGLILEGGEDPIRTGLVHRLDKDTSGVLILSKSQEAYEKLQAEFKNRMVEKKYHLLAHGKVRRMEYTCTKALGRHPVKRNTRRVDPQGRSAETYFELLEQFQKNYSLWQAQPKTGRTHQIRIHIKECGLSVVGDPHYSNLNSAIQFPGEKIDRTMLHCLEMKIRHPGSGEMLNLHAPYAMDFERALSALRG